MSRKSLLSVCVAIPTVGEKRRFYRSNFTATVLARFRIKFCDKGPWKASK